MLYYAFPVLAPAIAADTGWSAAMVTGAFRSASSSPAVLLVLVTVLVGAVRGIFTLVQATAVSDRWGPPGSRSPER
ncbi:hypothetical protein [Kutzneria chonburiensis]|uniref:TVP38/TMEM64 family membrane protein n=1 Tax=Kutzneria chonburiensis TaxID=1483604 RepID=A0ABV6N6T2_9PSEU|nr:hypothetical protein [Kutzneria chonburiensis]